MLLVSSGNVFVSQLSILYIQLNNYCIHNIRNSKVDKSNKWISENLNMQTKKLLVRSSVDYIRLPFNVWPLPFAKP